MSHFYVVGNRLQTAADSAALAAASHLGNIDDMRAEAAKYADLNVPEDTGTVTDADVTRGNWDFDTKTFDETALPINAVRVTAQKSSARGNAEDTYFARIIGFETVDLSASAIAAFETNEEWDVLVVQDVTGSFTDEIGDARDANQALLECLATRTSEDSLIGMVLFTGIGQQYHAIDTLEVNYRHAVFGHRRLGFLRQRLHAELQRHPRRRRHGSGRADVRCHSCEGRRSPRHDHRRRRRTQRQGPQ